MPFSCTITGQSCGQTYTSGTGTLNSVNYPENYPDRSDCSNIISVSGASRIQIQFDDFAVQRESDFLYYGVGSDPNAINATDSFTGSIVPRDFVVQSGTMWFLFTSDRSRNDRGFSLNWIATKDVPEPGGIKCLIYCFI